MKKTFCILLALVMVLTSCFVASAETTETATDLIGAYGSYDVPTYGWAFNALRTSLQAGDTEQADATYTAEELANTILYNKTGAGYGQWLGIDANTNLFSYEASNFVINQRSYGQSTYGIAFDENLKIVRAVRGFEVGKYYEVSFNLAHRFNTETRVVSDFQAGVVGQADLLNDITLNGGNFTETNTLTKQSFTFYADDSIVDENGYAYLMFRSQGIDAYVNNFSIVEWEPPVIATDWIVNDATSKNIGTNEGAVEYKGDGIVYDTKTFPERGETLKLDSDALRVSLPLNVEPNTDYILTFSYYTDAVSTTTVNNVPNIPYAITNTGIFIPNHPDFEGISGDRINFAYTMTYLNYYGSNVQYSNPLGYNWDKNGVDTGSRKYNQVPNYHNIEANKWYTLSFEFNSADFEDIAFTLKKFAGTNMWLDDVQLTVNQSVYFENPDNWVLSLTGSAANRRNISVDGTDGTYFSGEKGSNYHAVDTTVAKDAGGSSLKLLWASHTSNIAMPTLKSGKTYRLKFSYKVVTSEGLDLTKKQMNYIGLYSPSAVDKAIVEGNTEVKFSDRSVGWNSVDYFFSDGKYRYRDTTLTYCAQTSNRYDAIAGDYSYAAANEWYDEEIYFTATDYTDLYLVIVPGDDNKGGMFVDDFEFEEVDLNSTFTVDGENTPVSMRKATDGGVKQAIRYKFTVDNAIKANGTQGYELIEYGAVAASDKWLSENELPQYDLATGEGVKTELNKKSVVGVSYNKDTGKDVVFESGDNYTVYSAALYNIGYSHIDGTTNYTEWATDYIVRPYAVYYNEAAGHTVLVYGNEASASVFAVMDAILKSDNADDKAYVENLLSDEDIKTNYENAGYGNIN